MKLTIVSANDHSSFEIAWLELNTPVGNFIIQNGHAPTILALSPKEPVIFRLKTGKQQEHYPAQGIAQITRDSATLIINE